MKILLASFLKAGAATMAYRSDDLCPYGDEWKFGVLENPQQKGKIFVADISVAVRSRAAMPSDHQWSSISGSDIVCSKTVQITKERYDELIAGKR